MNDTFPSKVPSVIAPEVNVLFGIFLVPVRILLKLENSYGVVIVMPLHKLNSKSYVSLADKGVNG